MSTDQQYEGDRLVLQITNATAPGDPTPAGFTTWDVAGNVTAQRALTAAEAARLAAQDAAATTTSNDATTTQLMTAALPRLTQIINQGNTLNAQTTAWTVAQQKAVAQAIADLAQFDRYIIRKALRILDAAN